jgi:hypothetical protein
LKRGLVLSKTELLMATALRTNAQGVIPLSAKEGTPAGGNGREDKLGHSNAMLSQNLIDQPVVVEIPPYHSLTLAEGGFECKCVSNHYFDTRNCGLLLSVPDGVTTETAPVVAPVGTVALIRHPGRTRMRAAFLSTRFCAPGNGPLRPKNIRDAVGGRSGCQN